ncbi:MAG: DUF2628 domain-containing protein [Pedosphaera sp.]|nr:DUF2628 domain-containing protein [Pedosphaera sp.]
MKTYKVFARGNETVAVKQGWSWPAFFLQWIWAFSRKLAVIGGITLAVNIVVLVIPVKNLNNPYLVIAGVIFGLKGNKWREASLLKSGFSDKGTVQANNPAEAESNFKSSSQGFPFIQGQTEVAGSRAPNTPEQRPGQFR